MLWKKQLHTLAIAIIISRQQCDSNTQVQFDDETEPIWNPNKRIKEHTKSDRTIHMA